MASLIGQTIGGKYEILAQLGAGGMGAVYQARDLRLGRVVAVKALHLERDADPKDRERFLREARSLAMLEHSNVLPIYELLEVGDTAYMVMQYVKGGSLKDTIREAWRGDDPSGLDPDYVVALILQIARALDYAHNLGIIHRDIKPGNILLTEDGRTLLADFGIAKQTSLSRDASLTGEGVAVGTPAYMSPEQINGLELGPASDVYALAIVTYQLLTGHCPFEGDTISVIYKQVNEPPPPPTELNADIPPEVEYVLLKALDKDPSKRFARAGAFAAALQAAFAPVTGEIAVDRGPLGERVRESAAWGSLRRPQRREPAKGAPSAVRRFVVGALRTLIIIGIVLVTVAAGLTLGASLLLSRFIETATARVDWVLDQEYEITYSEEELGEMVANGLAFALPGTFESVEVNLQSPDTIILAGEREGGTSITLTSSVRLNEQGQPIIAIRRYNDVPLSLFGAAIAGGINRGFASALDEADGYIAQMTITNTSLSLDIRSRSGPSVTPTPRQSAPPPRIPITTNNVEQVVPLQVLDLGSGIFSTLWSTDGTMLVSGLSDGSIVLWSVLSGEGPRTLQAHRTGTINTAWMPATQRLASTGCRTSEGVTSGYSAPDCIQGDARVWDVATGQLVDEFLTGHTGGWPPCAAFSPHGTVLASRTEGGTIILWDMETGTARLTLVGQNSSAASLAWSPDGMTLAVGADNGDVILWNTRTGERLRTLSEHRRRIGAVTWSPDGNNLAAGADDRTVVVWDASTGHILNTLVAPSATSSLAWSPSGDILAFGGHEAILLWNAQTGERLVSLNEGYPSVAGGPSVASSGSWSTVSSIAWSPDTAMLATGMDQRYVIVWGVAG